MPSEQTTTKRRSENGEGNGTKQRERLIKQILRTTPTQLAREEARWLGFSPEEVDDAIKQMWHGSS